MNKFILLARCPDGTGIVHDVTGFILNYGGNILKLEEFVDQGNKKFFMRLVWDSEGFGLPFEKFDDAFSVFASDMNMTYEFSQTDRRERLALFCSKNLHCLSEVLMQRYLGNLSVDVCVIVSGSVVAADLALQFGVPFEYLPIKSDGSNKAEVEENQLALMEDHEIDVIGLAGYPHALPELFTSKYENKIIDVRHFFPSVDDGISYAQAHECGVKAVGATSHVVTADVDRYPIVFQDTTHLHHGLSAELMEKAGHEIEARVFVTALKKYLERKIIVNGNRTVVFE